MKWLRVEWRSNMDRRGPRSEFDACGAITKKGTFVVARPMDVSDSGSGPFGHLGGSVGSS